MRLCVVRLADGEVTELREFAYTSWMEAYRVRDAADGPMCERWPRVRHAVRWVA